jgi:hypothetical protein
VVTIETMAHRLLHSLVISSVMALEGLGCAFSHTPEPAREPPPDPLEPPPMGFDDGAVDAGPLDTGTADTGRPGTGSADTGAPDTGSPDTSPAPTDTGAPDGSDPRFCEPGWPTTKASFCRTIEEEDMPPRVECCSTVFFTDGGGRGEACCTPRPE